MTEKICILTAGTGSRLQPFTNSFNKILLPYKGKPVIDHILEKLPELPIVLVVGHKKEQVIEYVNFIYGNRTIEVVEVDDISIGPGYSLLQAEDKLQCPFYLACGDCIFDGNIPDLSQNWLGVAEVKDPKPYCTVAIDENSNIKEICNKRSDGYRDAFIGVAGIKDFDKFWFCLKDNKDFNSGFEMVGAWLYPWIYSSLKAVQLDWVDQGTTAQFLEHQTGKFDKNPEFINELTYIQEILGQKYVIKITDSEEKNTRRQRLSRGCGIITPYISYFSKHLSAHHFLVGNNLYECEWNVAEFFDWIDEMFIKPSNPYLTIDPNILDLFYFSKSIDRLKLLPSSKKKSSIINELLKEPEFWGMGRFTPVFHGDLNFSNIIRYKGDFVGIDWRDCFVPQIMEGGDLYYDLAKLYAGMITPLADVDLKIDLPSIRSYFEKWAIQKDLDLVRIKKLAGLVFANIAPLYLCKETKDNFLDLAYEYLVK